MLFESIQYRDDLPFEISLLNIGEESKHCHKEMEIIFVLRGVTHYQIYHTDYELNTGDLIIADTEDLHQIHDSSDDILMLSMHIDTARFADTHPNIRYMFFVCEECMVGAATNPQLFDNKLTLLKSQIARLAFLYLKENASRALLMEEINNLVSILVKYFQGFYMEDYQYKTIHNDMTDEDLQQICRITRYIMLNYRNKISLDDISKFEHLSSYYLSHLIKENLGFNFQNFVNAIRLEFAEKQLVFSNMTLMQISQDCGFSSPNYFNKCFSAWYGKTPSQYRKEYVPCERSEKKPFTMQEAFDLLIKYLNDTGGTDVRTQLLTPDMDFNAAGFKPLSGPSIVLDSIRSLINLGQNDLRLKDIQPSGFILDQGLLNRNRDLDVDMLSDSIPEDIIISNSFKRGEDCISASYLADAFDKILYKGFSKLSADESKASVIASAPMPSMAYFAYSLIFEHGTPSVLASDKYALLKTEDWQAAIFFNTEQGLDMTIHIPKNILPATDIILRRKFTSSMLPAHIIESLASAAEVPTYLMERIKQCFNGKITFPSSDSDIDFSLGYMETTILEFINI